MPLRPSREVQRDPDPDSTTSRSGADNPHQIRLALFARIGSFRNPPPDRALWREATALIIRTVDLARVRVSALVLQHVMWGFYFLADAAGHVSGYTEQQLATEFCCSKREVQRVVAIVNGIAVRRVRKNRRAPADYYLNLGGLNWAAVRRRAALQRQPAPMTDGAQAQKLDLAQAPSGDPGTPLVRPHALSGAPGSPLSSDPGAPPKGYNRGLRTSTAAAQYLEEEDPRASERPGAESTATDHHDEEQQLPPNQPTTTTPGSSPRTNGRPDAGTTEGTMSDNPAARAARLEGLAAAIAIRSRTLRRRFNETECRAGFAAGKVTLDELQALRDELEAAVQDQRLGRRYDWPPRYCAACGADLKGETFDPEKGCPRCGSPDFADAGTSEPGPRATRT